MHLIDDRSLARRFSSGYISSFERFLYFFFTVMFVFAILFADLIYTPVFPNLNLLSHLLGIFMNLGGIVWCYHTNSKGDNRDFIERYICIGLPVLLRAILIISPFTYFILEPVYFRTLAAWVGHYNATLLVEGDLLDEIIAIAYVLLFYFYSFKRLNSSIKIASKMGELN